MMETNNEVIQFVSTQRAKQKLVHRREYSTLKRTNHIKKCWICASGMRRCRCKLYTRDAVNSPTFYYQQQLNELKQLAAGDLRPVNEIYNELANNAYTRKDLPTYSRIFEVLHSKAEKLGIKLNLAKICL
ncbi:hypothetical protein T12_13297 [Trichinella patagoniensis]|uniref:FLYWCH-type domain-containing protein n=1 Tax=Trichinella patagoniensis TaxID=990121 RepID=A0A0V0ZA57_9BILA|nr:hypothetical protein T12_13297 [Trichinella patagoniensis]